jgi:hypothetical protein
MAAKSKTKASKGEKPERSEESKGAEKKLIRIRDRFKVMTEADETNRKLALEDLKFANEPGAQWDANMRQERGSRPCYEFNKCRINGKRVINEIRANRPSVKVRAVEGGDKEAAELREGLIRNVFNTSDFDTVTDQAAEYQVDGGMAAWRIVTEYSDDTAFDQDIKIKSFKNPFCVYSDPACRDVLKRDAEDWLITERMSKAAYEARWPDAEVIQFEDSVEFDDEDDWEDEQSVRICEYWYKEPYDKLIWLVKTPTGNLTVDMTSDEAPGVKAKVATKEYELVRERTARCHKIKMCIASGDSILEEADWAGTMFPFVMIYGEYKVIDGKVVWWGLHRFAKDAQRSYNVSRTAIDETIALAPQAKWWATAAQAKGLTGQWAVAHKENLPWLPYNPDKEANNGGPPQRMPGADVPIALLQQATVAAQDLRDVTGLHETSFGEESGEKSGVAIARKQNQAQIVTYNFPDNVSKGVLRTGEILLDLFPHIYDAEREMRILGADGAEDYVKVNEIVPGPPDEEGMPTSVRVNDMSAGKYDVTVKSGPNFSTRREEAAALWSEMASKFPQIIGVAGDLIAKSTDLPYADEIAQRLQLLLPPQIQQQLAEGKKLPPEVMAAQAQVQQAMEQVKQFGQMVQQAAQEAEVAKAEAEKEKASVETTIAKLDTKKAQFDAYVQKELAKLQQTALTNQANQMQGEREIEKQSHANETQAVIQDIQQRANDLINQAQQEQQKLSERVDQTIAALMQGNEATA